GNPIFARTACHHPARRILRYTVKTLAGLSVKEALDATHRARTSDVRSRVRKLFEQKKTLESEKAKLEALIGATARLSEERNKILHSAWSETEAGVTVRKRESDH